MRMLDLPFNLRDIQYELAGLDVTRAIKLMKKKKTRIKYANRGRLQL